MLLLMKLLQSLVVEVELELEKHSRLVIWCINLFVVEGSEL